MADVQWHFARGDGVRGGPVSETEIRRMLQAGELRSTDLIWREGLPQWQPAGQITAFANLAPPPLPVQGIGYAGRMPPPPANEIGQDAGMRMLLPVGRSGWAIASGYLGLLAVFPLVGVLFGLGAVITGLLAIKEINRNPQRHGMPRAIFGIVMGALFSVVYIIMIASMIASRKL